MEVFTHRALVIWRSALPRSDHFTNPVVSVRLPRLRGPWGEAYLWNMSADRLDRITVEEGKCGGGPCIRGQRIRVIDILELLAGGASLDEILADYAFLERQDIDAAIEYAAHQADHMVLKAS